MSSEIVIKFLVAAVLAGTPFLFGTVGEILSEKVGHLNLGVEGMMSIGACAGFMVGYQTDNFVAALLAAAVAGMLSALIYGVLTVTFMANQFYRCLYAGKIRERYPETSGCGDGTDA